jgi:hypothetical protein
MKQYLQYVCRSIILSRSSGFLCVILLSLTGDLEVQAQSRGASVSPLPWNPANSAFLLRNSASFSGAPISSNDVKIRYIGSDTIAKKAESPISFADFQAGVVFKPYRRFSFGIGELLPPISLKREIDDIPIVVLNSVNLVDLEINASIKYGLSLFGSYLLNEQLSVGAMFSSRQIAVTAAANTNAGERLMDGKFRLSTSSLKLGVNLFSPARRLRLGVASTLISSNSIDAAIETPLVSGPETQALNNSSVSSNLVFSDLLIGAEYQVNQKTTVYADLWWRRSDKNQKEFSLVDLKEKPKDIYDTASLFLGARYRSQPRQFVISEFSYEPSAVGAGSRGDDGKSGFGMRETAMLYSGFGDLVPAWSVSVGLQYGDGLPTINDSDDVDKPNRKSRGSAIDKKTSNDQSLWDRTTVSVSFRYKRASLGVDSEGELPGAYSQNRIQFPVTIQSVF